MARNLFFLFVGMLLIVCAMTKMAGQANPEDLLDTAEIEMKFWLREAEELALITKDAQALTILGFLKSHLTPVALIPEGKAGSYYVHHTRHKSGEKWLGFSIADQTAWDLLNKKSRNDPIALCLKKTNSIVIPHSASRSISSRMKGLVLLHEGYHAYLMHHPEEIPIKILAQSDEEKQLARASEEASILRFELSLLERLDTKLFKEAVSKRVRTIEEKVKTPGEDPKEMTYPKQEVESREFLSEIFGSPSTSQVEQNLRSSLVGTAALNQIFAARKKNSYLYEVRAQMDNIYGR